MPNAGRSVGSAAIRCDPEQIPPKKRGGRKGEVLRRLHALAKRQGGCPSHSEQAVAFAFFA